MTSNPIQFSHIDIRIDKILARLGHAAGKTKIDEKTRTIIDEEIALSKKLMRPQQALASSNISLCASDTIALKPSLHIRSKKIYDLLSPCYLAYGFVVTIGPHLEEKRNLYLDSKETSRALILDAIGSVIVEELAEVTNKQIKREMKENNIEFTMRFSPGYGDWELAGQKDFLAWIGADAIGIKLTDSFQMLPEKSVSAILGIKKRIMHEQNRI